MSECLCNEIPILWAAQADAYAGAHLVCEEVGEDGAATLRCVATDRRWLQDHPTDAEGVMTLRLRWQALSPADIVAYLNGRPALDDLLLTMHPAVEHQPFPDEPVLHGVDELREYVQRIRGQEHPPLGTPIKVVERDDAALVLGQVSHNHDGRYVEHRPAAWIVTVRDARVVSVQAFSDWAQAREAAGVSD